MVAETKTGGSNRIMLWRLLGSGDWKELTGLLSPALFALIPPRELSARLLELTRNRLDRSAFTAACRLRDGQLSQLEPSLRCYAEHLGPRVPLISAPDAALTLFFGQVLLPGPMLLDLRQSSFHRSAQGQLSFSPTQLFADWTPEFRAGMTRIYDAFYRDQSSAYIPALEGLGVKAASSVFERAFGGVRRHAATFQLSDFRHTFTSVFELCKRSGTTFHPDFVTLGVALVTLYDHLEQAGGSYDVAGVWTRLRERQLSEGCADSRRPRVAAQRG